MSSHRMFSMSAAAFVAAIPFSSPAMARTTADMGPSALAGTVSSPQEGKMEGVLVSAQKDGSNIVTTVVTNEKGRYAFPASRLSPGHYALTIRAMGYDLAQARSADVVQGKGQTEDLKLKAAANLEDQMTSADWLNSMPGTDDQKRFLRNCVGCHTLQRIVKSTYTADDFTRVLPLMGTFAPGAVPEHPQQLAPSEKNRMRLSPQEMKAITEFLASINESSGPHKWAMKRSPRPSGRDTHVIVTTYLLPRKEAEPHDADYWENAPDGKIWFTDFRLPIIGALDPKTGGVTEYREPIIKENEPTGMTGLKRDPDGNIWISMMYQAGYMKMDPKTKEITTYPYPKEWQNSRTMMGELVPDHMDVDGWMWGCNQENHNYMRFNPKLNKWENLGDLKDQNGGQVRDYGMISDEQNNLYAMDFGGSKIGKVDAKTGQMYSWSTVFTHSQPRRVHWGADGNIWFAEYGANGVGKFDPKTGKIQEWRMPLEWSLPYDALRSKQGDVYTGSMLNDRVTRFNPDTGDFVNYLLPYKTEIRYLSFDQKRNTLWTSGVHSATIVNVEPLD